MSLVSGPIFQVAWVVPDIAATERWFTDMLGVPRWVRFTDVHFGPEHCRFRGEPADFVVHVALGYAGTQQLELIQPVSGRNLYVEHIERSGGGLHHIAFVPDDFAAALAAAEAAGIAVSQQGEFAGTGIEFAYLDAAHAGAPHVELLKLSPEATAWFASLATP